MIPGPHRMKGGAAQLGVAQTGRRGPFGVRGEEGEPEFSIALHTQVAPGALERFLMDIRWHHLVKSLQQGRFSRDLYTALSPGGEVLGALEGQISCAETEEHLTTPTSRVFNLATAPRARRRGIATALMKRFELDAIAAGRRSLWLAVDLREPQDERVAFFESCGLHWLGNQGLYMGADLPLDSRDPA